METIKSSPIRSWPRIKILTPSHLCEIPFVSLLYVARPDTFLQTLSAKLSPPPPTMGTTPPPGSAS